MKTLLSALVLTLSLGLAAMDADAARRFGGGGNLGKQRPAPTMREAAPQSAPSQAARPAQQATPAATPGAAAQPKPSFMSRFGGLLAGLGIGALLGSLFGHMGGMGGLLMLLVLAAVLFMVMRAFAARRHGATPYQAAPAGMPPASMREAESGSRPVFSGIGSAIPTGDAAAPAPTTYEPALSSPLPADFNRDAFLRVAKTSFIRLQAANDAKDLDDIRDYTTPEMYAEIAMQLGERADEAQKTEVVSLDAQLYDYAIDGDHEIASVRFHGLIRETAHGNPEPFDEVWHVRKKRGDPRAPWLIAGIQQAA
jgi:predicted lipid-binding transport protein (Tim44 family)